MSSFLCREVGVGRAIPVNLAGSIASRLQVISIITKYLHTTQCLQEITEQSIIALDEKLHSKTHLLQVILVILSCFERFLVLKFANISPTFFSRNAI
jgi:hypothetical protein